MTNVRSLRHIFRLPASSVAVSGGRCCASVPGGMLRALRTTAAGFFTVLILTAGTPQSSAQDYLFGRTAAGSSPAGQVIDVNAQGLGFSARGGHIAGNEVGRRQSASIIGISPYVNIGDGLFFGDTRLTYANNGEIAYSFGAGYRHYVTAWDAVIGGYGYYDWDEITGADLKQWSYGAEILSHRWEARGNVYRPYGTTSARTATRIDSTSAVFVGNRIEFSRIDTFAEALQGFDAEVGFLLPGDFSERFDIRAFGGGYAYKGEGQPTFSGFSTRLQADIGDWLELGLKLTDDEILHTNVSFSAIVHFGSYYSQEHTSRSSIQRLAEPVRRNLNVAAAVTDVTVGGLIANGTDGLPLNIVHVNSNVAPGGTGTVDDPFNQLSTGLGVPDTDVVFVHAGSNFPGAPDNIVTLADGQSVFGEGLIPFGSENRKVENTILLDGIGELTLPDSPTFAANLATLGPDPFGPLPATTPVDAILLRPTIAATLGDAVTLGNNSRLGGFIIDSPTGNGIVINGVSGTNVRDTLINGAGGSGILIQNMIADSTTTILDTIVSGAVGPAFHVDGGAGSIGFNATSSNLDPSFGAIVNSSQEAVLVENRTGGNVNMFGTTIDDTGGTGIVIRDTIGNVTVDNANIVNSTSTGISITNSEGNFLFRNSIRPATTVDTATDDSIQINGIAAGSSITFENLSITNPLSSGIDIDNLGGDFVFTQDLTIGAPGVGAIAAPAISVSGSQATGVVRFGRDVTIQGSAGRGLEIAGNTAGSSFTVDGLLTVIGATAESIAIENNAGIVNMVGGTGISQRAAGGILIDNSTGPASFRQGTVVLNENTAQETAVLVQNSESLVLFEDLTVTNALTGGGVNLQNNLAGAIGTGELLFNTINITSAGGTGFMADTNTNIRIGDGTIASTTAAAVDIVNSGINIRLESVDSTASPDFGINLVDTNREGMKTFTVTGDTSIVGFGTGGTITAAATSGINMQNAGQVSLTSMTLDDNNYGIFVRNSGLTDEDDQFLDLQFVQVIDSDGRGIDAENLIALNIEDSIFTNNGEAAVLNPAPDGTIAGFNERETIFMNYTELLNDEDTTLVTQFDNPYLVNIERTIFVAEHDAIEMRNAITAADAHLDFTVIDSDFTLSDSVLNIDQERGIFVEWDGVVQGNIFNNTVTLAGTIDTELETAFDIRNDSFTDELVLDVTSNSIPASVQPNAIGLFLSTNSITSALVNNNDFTFSGEDSVGMQFDLGPNTEVALLNNNLTFQNDGGTGMLFTMVDQPSNFTISGNSIGLTDLAIGTNETGILFRTVIGTPGLQGLLNNEIILLNPGFIGGVLGVPTNINIDFQIPRANGQILINGALRP